MAEKQINPRLVWTVSILLALLFGGIGVLLLVNPTQSVGQRVPVDQLSYLRGLGAALCVGAVLLLVPRVAWFGAVLLAVILVGLIGVCAYQGEWSQMIVPALFLVSVASLAYIRRPRSPTPAPPKPEAVPVAPPSPSPLHPGEKVG